MSLSRAMIALAALFTSAGAAQMPAAAEDVTYESALGDWSRVLERFVDSQGRTDFIRLAQDRAELDSFVAYLASWGPTTRPAEFDTSERVLAGRSF